MNSRDMYPRDFTKTVTALTSGIFEAALSFQAALDGPAGALRQVVERALDLLDQTVRDARAAAFAWHEHTAHDHTAHDHTTYDHTAPRLADEGRSSAAGWHKRQASAGLRTDTGEEPTRLGESLAMAARETRARSRQLRERTLAIAALAAITEDQVATSMIHLANSHPRHVDHLQTLSLTAAGHATRMRRWAQDHAATG
jgi:hypothetical protein